ncbi:lysylphosphatidylglycerol synthase transmembrane domain-containing protein [Streptomyces aureus]|uniref:lysylphosphatidylglycerol synthase domain-containing protein n=1 Tax=Streptomyces aureus TaxID=193461 RepID=UPI00099BFABB
MNVPDVKPTEAHHAEAHRGDGSRTEGPGAEVRRAGYSGANEPFLPARCRRAADLLRLLTGVLGIALLLVVAWGAHATTSGVEHDVSRSTTAHTSRHLIDFLGSPANLAVLLVPVLFALERLLRRDGARVADGVLAAVLAHGAALGTGLWVTRYAPFAVHDALTRVAPGGGVTDPVHGYVAPVVAFMTAVGTARRPRWRATLWTVLVLNAFTTLAGGYTTLSSVVLTLLIGWSVGCGTLYAVGTPNVRPTTLTLLAALRRAAFTPIAARQLEDPASSPAGRGRRYRVTREDGAPLDVTVVDREQQAHAFMHQAWRQVLMRPISERGSLQSLRQRLEQETLLAYAAVAAGARTPRLIGGFELGPDAVMLVHEHAEARPLDLLTDEEVGDAVLDGVWDQVRLLHARRIAHRRLTGDSLLVDGSGGVLLTGLGRGEIAAGDILLRMDTAQLLTTLALRVGPERAVASATRVLGPDAVAGSLPMLQPIALSRSTRTTLRRLAGERAERERQAAAQAVGTPKDDSQHAVTSSPGGTGDDPADGDTAHTDTPDGRTTHTDRADGDTEHGSPPDAGTPHGKTRDTIPTQAKAQDADTLDSGTSEHTPEDDPLALIRRQVLLMRPEAPVAPARLERIRPRTLVTLVGGVAVASYLLSQLVTLDLNALIEQANWTWAVLALAFSALTYVAAAMTLLGFVPEKVPFGRTVLAQLASSFALAPAAVGGIALNTRFLQRNQVRPGFAVASVGASQLAGGVGHVLLIVVFGYATGTQDTTLLSPSSATTVIGGLLAATVLALAVAAVPPLRRFVTTRVRALFSGVLPRLLDLLQQPAKLVTGFGGILLLNLAYIACLDASVRAFGHSIGFAPLAFAYLVGSAAGSAIPTPGGIGGVETALASALTLAGLPASAAFSAVLLYRLLTFWLPVLPGWLAFSHLVRKQLL